jgi:hypothetical protein
LQTLPSGCVHRRMPIRTGLRQRLPVRAEASADRPLTKLTVGIAGCCAFPASGHAAAAPPSSVMNFRRLMLSTGDFLPISAADRSTRSVRRMLSLPQGG